MTLLDHSGLDREFFESDLWIGARHSLPATEFLRKYEVYKMYSVSIVSQKNARYTNQTM